jgi:phosphoglucosamine mutase
MVIFMGILFGTDGIRGKVNSFPMTCEIALKTGRAVGQWAAKNGYNSVIIGKDTRISGDMLEAAISAGLTSVGINAVQAGIIPTPGIAFLCKDMPRAGAGIVISASHNPYQDNGIKIFDHAGNKLSDETEAQLEKAILEDKDIPGDSIGRIENLSDGTERYARFLSSKFKFRQLNRQLKLIIDCANGAACEICPMVFETDMFDIQIINDKPDGININKDCGSQYVDRLSKVVLDNNADLGLAFDGDADRLIAVDETGAEVAGDRILAVCAQYARQKNQLRNNIIVSTIMSNVGLTEFLGSQGIKHVRAGVGDRKVLEEMKKQGALIGGEDSGHLIFLDQHTTGDGLLSALKLLEVIINTGQPLSELANVIKLYPQILKNMEVDESRPDIMKIDSIVSTIKKVEKLLGNQGRVLLRYSGTQPLLRVMVEGPDYDEIAAYCNDICESVRVGI